MKRIFLFLSLSLFIAHTMTAQTAPRKKVAVVLSGGGAKGMAHIGVLKVLEEAGIPIDIITGTSMGSIVGGLYSIGYNAELLDSLVRQQDWNFILSDRENLQKQSIGDREKSNTYMMVRSLNSKKKSLSNAGLINGKNLSDLFQKVTYGYSDSIDFNQLPIPFACVATDIVTNTEYDFHSGTISQAMRASMAIPAAFSPVRKGDMVLVDGGLRNNYPADIARQMGADYIIGVTLQGAPKTADDLTTATSILSQIIDVNCKNKYEENLAITDIPIHVNTTGYSTTSFTPAAVDTLIRRGHEAAMEHWDELLEIKRKLGLPSDYRHPLLTPKNNGRIENNFKVADIQYENMNENDIKYIQSKFKLKNKTEMDTQLAELITTTMRLDLFYSTASYRTYPTQEGEVIVFRAGDKKSIQAALGVRFDTEEMAALQANTEIPLNTKVPTNLNFTLRLGMRIMARAALELHPHSIFQPKLAYTYRHNDIDVYKDGNKDFNITFNQHTFDVNVLSFNVRNLTFNIGARWDYYNFKDLLINHRIDQTEEQLKDDNYFSYYARADYNSENDWYFPSRGTKFYGQYSYVTDNLAGLNHHHGMSEVAGMWRTSIPFNSRLTLQPMLYSRFLFGSEHPYAMANIVGGEWFHHYFEQQMPFPGVRYIEPMSAMFAAFQLQAQQRIGMNNFIRLQLAAAQQSDKFKSLFDHSTMFGTAMSYYYMTPLGPMGGSLGYSNRTDGLHLYINLGFEF